MPRVSLAERSASVVIYHLLNLRRTFPSGASGKELICKCRRQKRCGFNPWIGKIPWRREWLPTPVFLPGRILWTEEWQAIGSQRVTHELKRHACMSLRQVIRKAEDSRWPLQTTGKRQPGSLTFSQNQEECHALHILRTSQKASGRLPTFFSSPWWQLLPFLLMIWFQNAGWDKQNLGLSSKNFPQNTTFPNL